MCLDERRVGKLIFKARQVGVASVGFAHMSDEKSVGQRKKCPIDLGATDQVDCAIDARKFCEFIGTVNDFRAG